MGTYPLFRLGNCPYCGAPFSDSPCRRTRACLEGIPRFEPRSENLVNLIYGGHKQAKMSAYDLGVKLADLRREIEARHEAKMTALRTKAQAELKDKGGTMQVEFEELTAHWAELGIGLYANGSISRVIRATLEVSNSLLREMIDQTLPVSMEDVNNQLRKLERELQDISFLRETNKQGKLNDLAGRIPTADQLMPVSTTKAKHTK